MELSRWEDVLSPIRRHSKVEGSIVSYKKFVHFPLWQQLSNEYNYRNYAVEFTHTFHQDQSVHFIYRTFFSSVKSKLKCGTKKGIDFSKIIFLYLSFKF